MKQMVPLSKPEGQDNQNDIYFDRKVEGNYVYKTPKKEESDLKKTFVYTMKDRPLHWS